MFLSSQRHPPFSFTNPAAAGGVAQNMLGPPSASKAMHTQKGATGPAGGSPCFVKEPKQYSHAFSLLANGPTWTCTKACEDTLITSEAPVALECAVLMLFAGTLGFPRSSTALANPRANVQRKHTWRCIVLDGQRCNGQL